MEIRVCWIFLFVGVVCLAEDGISGNQSLADGQTLVSAGNVFELGFFSPDNSSGNRFLGIWYSSLPERPVVWVANRENPISAAASPALLTIQPSGNLAILDANKKVIWSANTTANYATARLLASGNLVLTEGNSSGDYLWQSFDYPGNTLLPGMKIGYNKKTHEKRVLLSWRSETDPFPGRFTYGVDPQDAYQFFIWNGSIRHWRSGLWNGREYNQIPMPSNTFVFHFRIGQNDDEAYFQYSSQFPNTRLVMDVSGQVHCQVWSDSSRRWSIVWQQPASPCDRYRACGENSICSDFDSSACKCMTGFEPVSPAEWDSGDHSRGCKRMRELECGEREGFLSLGILKVPDGESASGAGNEDCEAECRKNCSCTAYVYANTNSSTALRCLHWFGNLSDVEDVQENEGFQYLHIKRASSELDPWLVTGSRKKRSLALIVSLTTVTGIFLLGGVLCYFRRLKVKNQGNDEKMFIMSSPSPSETAPIFENLRESKNDGKQGLEVPCFSFVTVSAATDHFSISNLLGHGGFGDVYWGKLAGGQEIAAKRLGRSSHQGLEEFSNEAILIAKLQHRNLVRLLGYCVERNEKILIYEFMPNKSLDAFLFDPQRSSSLDWEKRFNIILGIARGLLYLQRDSRLRIIHRDLKTSNILLDQDMNPKISDFGMARIFGGKGTQENTNRVVGTYGYMSPEYALDGIFSVKSDIFSFGVIVLEIVSGKKNTAYHDPDDSLSLLGYSWKLWTEGKALELMDPALGESANPPKVLKCIEVGLLCVQDDPGDRPSVASIVANLVGENPDLPLPKQPASYFSKPSSVESSSRKEATSTQLEGR